MKKAILCAVLAALPLAAQSWEVGLFVGQQSYDKHTFTTPLTFEAKPDSKTMGAIRLGYSLADLGPVLFQINAALQPKTSTTMHYTFANTTPVGIDVGQNLDHQATSLGLMFHFKAGVALGAGVDYRWDKLEGDVFGSPTSTTYGRPWARASVGFAIPSPVLKPFLGLEVAVPLVTKSLGSTGPQTTEDILKAYAPKLQIGLYGGLRF